VLTACALACAGDLDGALRSAGRGQAATRDVPVLAVPNLAAQAHLLSRLDRHDEAAVVVATMLATAERLDSVPVLGLARHDAGLVALAAGRFGEASDLLTAALDADAAVSRSAAGLALAEALACRGDAAAAAVALRRAALEPVRPADQPWALVPRMARVQGLVARARGDRDEARRRLVEAAAGWRRCGAGTARQAGEQYMAALVDLGRPPVVGLVEPDRELARVVAELAQLEGADARVHAQQ
jgi:tetratricopeptide (TPR) repeat protein